MPLQPRRGQSARAPMVFLIDDLHWIDRASDEVVAQLAHAIEGTRAMVLVNFRPEYDGPWMKSSHYQQLPLLPLGPEGIEAMLGELLGTDPSVKELKTRIRERTGGNPSSSWRRSCSHSPSLERLREPGGASARYSPSMP
jgi:predicted ATPase